MLQLSKSQQLLMYLATCKTGPCASSYRLLTFVRLRRHRASRYLSGLRRAALHVSMSICMRAAPLQPASSPDDRVLTEQLPWLQVLHPVRGCRGRTVAGKGQWEARHVGPPSNSANTGCVRCMPNNKRLGRVGTVETSFSTANRQHVNVRRSKSGTATNSFAKCAGPHEAGMNRLIGY